MIATLFQILFQSRLFTNFFRCILRTNFWMLLLKLFQKKKITGGRALNKDQKKVITDHWKNSWLAERKHEKFCKSPAIHFRILINQTSKSNCQVSQISAKISLLPKRPRTLYLPFVTLTPFLLPSLQKDAHNSLMYWGVLPAWVRTQSSPCILQSSSFQVDSLGMAVRHVASIQN